MSPTRAAGGASALYGAGLIITNAARVVSRSSVTVMGEPPGRWTDRTSEVGVLEGGIAAVVEGTDPLDAVGVDRRTPVRVHHDRDRLLDRLARAEVDRALDSLDGRRRVADDLVGDPLCGLHQLVGFVELVDHAEPVGLVGGDRVSGEEHLERLAAGQETGQQGR